MMGSAILVAITALAGVAPAPGDFVERDAWVAAKFQGVQAEPPNVPGLIVVANYNPLQKNAHDGKPMLMQGVQYARGLHCHAYSNVIVKLPAPGQRFTSTIGVDSNSMTSGGRGSIVFAVLVHGQKAFQSEVLHEGMAPVAVDVDLKGAAEFVLEITDAGDGISCDQANWAEAKAVLADGKALWLDELDVIDRQKKPPTADPFISFVYGGHPSSEFLSSWKLERATKELDAFRTEYTLTYTDPATALVVRCVGVAWKDYPTVEWTAYLKNTGAADTPIIESIQAIDTAFERNSQGEFLLHHHIGDKCSVDSFAPVQTSLAPNASQRFAPDGGRPSNGVWPYFNLESPAEEAGVILAIGWPGQWEAQFARDGGQGLRVSAGQELTHFTLHAGEEVRTPLIVLQFYKGDWIRAQNIWRRWMFDHNFPNDHGKPLSVKLGTASVQHFAFNCTQAGDTDFINRCFERGVNLSYWWMDAGWYVNDGAGWPKVGTWEVDKARFPGGLKAITDLCHQKGCETIVWFEVERVSPDTWLTKNHPEWIHGGAGGGLFKMDDPAAVAWITDHIDKMITDEGIDLYRSDFNIDPLSYWRGNDAENRQGITEIRYIEGYLSYWDELKRRHPGMLIDACASGGRRDDLESMRRAVPLLRTDFEQSAEGNQCATYGFDLWLPYHNGVNWYDRPYNFCSSIGPFLQLNWDIRQDTFNIERGLKFLAMWRKAAEFYFGDLYPLSTYSTADDVWIAWQFDRPDQAAGLVQAFRRANCPYVSAQYKLRAIEPEATYVVTDLFTDQATELTGKALMDPGLLIALPELPQAALLTYAKKK